MAHSNNIKIKHTNNITHDEFINRLYPKYLEWYSIKDFIYYEDCGEYGILYIDKDINFVNDSLLHGKQERLYQVVGKKVTRRMVNDLDQFRAK